MKFTKLATTLLCSVVLFCGCTKNSDVVLKVNDKGVITGVKSGSAIVTAKIGNVSSTTKVVVSDVLVSDIDLNMTDVKMNVADEITVTLTGVVAKKNKPVKERALDCIVHLNGNNMKKVFTSKRLKDCKDEKDFKAFVSHTKSKSLKACLHEAIFALE